MRRRQSILVVLLACVALLAGRAIDAQNAPRPHPLLALLALTPDAPFVVRGAPFLRYTDYRALRAAGLPISCSHNDEPDWFTQLLAQPAFAQARLGFNPLVVERALAFGQPPAGGVILEGDFDAAAISTALAARGYLLRDEQGILIAQPADGPRPPREQIALAGRYLMMTPKAALLDDLVNAYIGYQQSLYSELTLLSLAEALARQPGELLSATFFDTAAPPPGLPRSLAALFRWRPGGLAALADYRQDGARVTLLALVDGERSLARQAARMLTLQLRERGAVVLAPTVYQGAGGYFVALARASRLGEAVPRSCAL